jgi:ribosomal protein S27AE
MVNASSIEYSISTDSGTNWSSWTNVSDYFDAAHISVQLTLEFADSDENRIKWRAADVAGNGLTESEVYTVKVYDIQTEDTIPKVQLISPLNGTIVTSTSVLFNWSVDNLIKTGITYDLFLDTVNPPVVRRVDNHNKTSVMIDELEEGETYYWTIVSWRLIDGNYKRGVCTNGTWSFTVDTSSIPKVSLSFPEDEAVINKIWLTLAWQLNYGGSGVVTYDVHFDTNPDPSLRSSGVTQTYQQLENELEDGQTYYWKIVPSVDGIPSPESETWSFTVDLSKAPYIDFSLQLDKTSVELKPGENITVTGSIKNLGDVEDSIQLKLINPSETIVIGSISKSNILNITPNEIIDFIVEIEIPLGVIKQNVTLTIEATSESAPDYELEIKREANLIVNIIEETSVDPTKPKKDGEPSNNLGLIIGFIVIIIIVVIIITLFLIKKKKQPQPKEEGTSPPTAMEPAQPPVVPVPYMQPMQPMQPIPPIVPMQPIAAPIPQIGTAMPMNIQQPILPQSAPTSTVQPQAITQPQQVSSTTQQNLCSTCGQELIFNQQNNNYYCGHCQKAGD